MKTRDAYMHEVDLGQAFDDEELRHQVNLHGKEPAFQAVLQWIRNKATQVDKSGRQVPVGADPHDYRAYHGGGADALEEIFWDLYQATMTDLDKELEEGE